jgi:small subunit ribosomal protein S19
MKTKSNYCFLKKFKMLPTKKRLSYKTWSRSCKITSPLVGMRLKVHNGKTFMKLFISNEMIGHKLGEFVWTRGRFEFKKKKKKKKKK